MEKYLVKRDDESIDEYIIRISKCKDEFDLTWQDIADVVNQQCGLTFGEGYYRKKYKKYRDAIEYEESVNDTNNDNREENLAKLLSQIRSERLKLSDERNQCNAQYRRLNREETLKEIAHDFAKEMSSKKMLDSCSDENIYINDDNIGILTISDWHYGVECDNYWNTFNTEIAKKRIAKLTSETIYRCKQNNVNKLYVVNLADLIAGRIHLQIRLNSRIDVITQIMEVSEIVAEMLSLFTANNISVEYYDCLDNHSRVEPNKSDSLDLESLARLTPWYLKERLCDNPLININENIFDNTIVSFEWGGFNVVGVHGDKDRPQDVIDNLSLMTHKHYDLVLTAHLHHFSGDEKNETLVISNGSLMGTDDYAKGLRLSSKPSQNLIIANKNNIMDTLYRIILD